MRGSASARGVGRGKGGKKAKTTFPPGRIPAGGMVSYNKEGPVSRLLLYKNEKTRRPFALLSAVLP